MSTVTAPAPAGMKPKPSKIPTLNPWAAPAVICPNRGCNKVLFPVMAQSEKGGEPELRYDCEPCNYSFYAGLTHVNGICRPMGAKKSPVPEIMQPKG
jgi:hypothetical protein